MKHTCKFFAVAFAALACCCVMEAKGFHWGTKYVRVTGVEKIERPADPGWTSFAMKQTLSVPWLKVEDMVIIIDTTEGRMFSGETGSYGYGPTGVYTEGGELIGMSTYTLFTELVGFEMDPTGTYPVLVHWRGDALIAGSFFEGPLAAMALNEKVEFTGSTDTSNGETVVYDAEVAGYLSSRERMTRKEWMALFE